MRNQNTCQFRRVPVSQLFTQNGNAYIKRSTRTALLPEYGRWFYFSARETVEVSDAVRSIIELNGR